MATTSNPGQSARERRRQRIQSLRIAGFLLLGICRLVAQQPQATAASHVPIAPVESTVTVESRTSDPLGETAKTSYVLKPEEVQDSPAPTLDDVLRLHAGFELFRRSSSRVTNPTSQGISLRGLGSTAASRTLVLKDGAPLNDPFGAWIHWNETPQIALESVTIVTGGGSDLYGSSALGGVIDIVPSPVEKTLLSAQALGGSQGTETYQARADRRFASVAAESLRTDGYVIVAPQFAGRADAAANVHSEALHTELGRRDSADHRYFFTGNVFNEARGNGTRDQTNGTRLWRYLGGFGTPQNARLPARLRLFGTDEAYRQSFSAIAADRNSETLTRLQAVRTQELGATGDATLHNRLFSVVVGADARDLRSDDKETPYAKGLPLALQQTSARQRYSGGFVEALGAYKHWSGAASLRVDFAQNLDIRQSPASAIPNRIEVVPSPRIGVQRAITPLWTAHASAFRAFRSPTMNELYRTGQVGSETTLANPALRSERATGAEAGLELITRQHSVQATYFFTEINRPVSAVLLTQTATTITEQRQNLGQIQSQGVELAATVFKAGVVSGTLGYQYAHATVTSFAAQPSLVGNWIPQVPRQTATAQMQVRQRQVGDLILALRTSGQSYDDAVNSYVLRRFFSLDLSGRRTLGHGMEIFVQAQNLFNQRADVSRTPILTLGSGIFAQAGLRLRLGSSPH